MVFTLLSRSSSRSSFPSIPLVADVAIRRSGVHDLIGARGEASFSLLVTREHPVHGFLFELPRHLGEKKRGVDFFVELFSTGETVPYFLVQVKTTRTGYTPGGRLKVGIGGDELRRLAAYPAPTYVVGIDEPAQRGYIVSANGESTSGFSRMCTEFPLTPDVLAQLHREVEAYWEAARPTFASAFVDSDWREQ